MTTKSSKCSANNCDWVQVGDRKFQCIRCQRVLYVPNGLPMPPDFSRLPPCGWKPDIIRHGGHRWYEMNGITPKTYSCPICGARSSDPYNAEPCRAQQRTIAQTVSRYAQAVARWTAAGFPTRSDEEVQRLYAICRSCVHFDHGHCRLCGCRCNTSNFPLVNKLRMATESCPDNPPRWTALCRSNEST